MTTESGRLISIDSLQAHYRILHLQLPEISQHANPGAIVQIEGHSLPVLRCQPQRQQLEVLCPPCIKDNFPIGDITAFLADSKVFNCPADDSPMLLLGEGLGMAPIIHLAERIKGKPATIAVMLGFDQAIPFRPHPSHIMLPGVPAGIIATMPLLESWNIPCRIASTSDLPGCYIGQVESLAAHWLDYKKETLDCDKPITLYASGDERLVNAAHRLSETYNLNAQIIEIG